MARSLLIALVISLAVFMPSARAQEVKIPPISIKNNAVELGTHAPGASAIKEIKVRNTSDKPITIRRAAGNCSCMTLIVRDAQIAPGKQGTIILAVDAPKKMGRLTREMYIFLEGYTAPARIPVYADLQYAVVVNKGALPELIQREGVLTLTSSDAKAFRVLSAGEQEPVSAIEGHDLSVPATMHALRYNLGTGEPAELPRFFTITTDHPDAKLIPVRVSAKGLWQAWRDRRRIRPVAELETLFRSPQGKSPSILVEFAGVEPGPAETMTVVSSNPKVTPEVLALRKPPQGGGGAACDVELRVSKTELGPIETVLTFTYKGNEAGLDVFMVIEPRNRKTSGRKSPISGTTGR